MCNEFISSNFIQKLGKSIITDNIYSSKIFVDFYCRTTGETNFYNDLLTYRNNINRESSILEIGTGAGRVLIPLKHAGYNITGIEYSKEMINMLPEKYKQYVNNISVFDIKKNDSKKYDYIIIPATTISLFSSDQIRKLIPLFKSILNNHGKIMFDYMEPMFFEMDSNKLMKETYNGRRYYFCNFINKDKVIYNIYSENKLGYSVKFLHSEDNFKSIFNEFGFTYTDIYNEEFYHMVEIGDS